MLARIPDSSSRIPDSSSRIPDSSSDQRTGYDPSFVGPPIEPPAPRGRRRSRGRITRRARHDFRCSQVEPETARLRTVAAAWQRCLMSASKHANAMNLEARRRLTLAALVHSCGRDNRCCRSREPWFITQNLTVLDTLPMPLRCRPGAQCGVEQIIAVFVGLIVKRGLIIVNDCCDSNARVSDSAAW